MGKNQRSKPRVVCKPSESQPVRIPAGERETEVELRCAGLLYWTMQHILKNPPYLFTIQPTFHAGRRATRIVQLTGKPGDVGRVFPLKGAPKTRRYFAS